MRARLKSSGGLLGIFMKEKVVMHCVLLQPAAPVVQVGNLETF